MRSSYVTTGKAYIPLKAYYWETDTIRFTFWKEILGCTVKMNLTGAVCRSVGGEIN